MVTEYTEEAGAEQPKYTTVARKCVSDEGSILAALQSWPMGTDVALKFTFRQEHLLNLRMSLYSKWEDDGSSVPYASYVYSISCFIVRTFT